MCIREDGTTSPFLKAVEQEFRFLVESGFRRFIEGETAVRYENDRVFVRVFHDGNDKYLGFRIGLLNRPKDALTTTELARLAGAILPRGEYPERSDQLHTSVSRIAEQLRTYGERALSGDEDIYDEAMNLRRNYTQKFMREWRSKSPPNEETE